MQPPAFWFTDPARPALAARMLAPLGRLTASATARRVARAPGAAPAAPVICVGNLSVGGTGKTPLVMDLLARLSAHGPQVISRGYGGRLTGPVRVDAARHCAADVGDEPLLLSAFAPVWVARDRAEGAQAAMAEGAGALILDDGFQNPALRKDLSIVVVDAVQGFGNGRCLPAGPLREPVRDGLARADLLLLLGDPAARARFTALWGSQVSVPVVEGSLEPLATGMPWAGMRVLAFAGIGRPEKFFATLRRLGVDLVATRALSDHQPLTEPLMSRLLRDAHAAGAQLVTTEKDAVRLPDAMRREVLTLPVRIALTDSAPLDAALAPLFG